MSRFFLAMVVFATLGWATPALGATCTFSTSGAGGVTDVPCRSLDLLVSKATTSGGAVSVDYTLSVVRTIDAHSAELERMLFLPTLRDVTFTFTPDAGSTVQLELRNSVIASRDAIDDGKIQTGTETLVFDAGSYTWTVIP